MELGIGRILILNFPNSDYDMSNGHQNNHGIFRDNCRMKLSGSFRFFKKGTVAVGAIGLQLQLGQNIWMCMTPQTFDGYQCMMTDIRS